MTRSLPGLALLVLLIPFAAAPAAAQGPAAAAPKPWWAQAIDGFEALVFYEIPGLDIPVIVIWMFAPMVYLTLRCGFINLRSFPLAFAILRGRYHEPDAPGEVTQFQALSTALSGTVGLGNIAGVAVAIGKGGPGAVFWMVIIGFFAMTLKFAECTLAVKYRRYNADGTVSGGPMYYLRAGLANLGRPKLGAILGTAYAALAVWSLIQWASVQQTYSAVSSVMGVSGWEWEFAFGLMLAVLVGLVILGGIRSIASVTARLVPLMAFVYVAGALFILLGHAVEIPAAFGTIVSQALSPDTAAQAQHGGLWGAIIVAFAWGMKRAVYSTEAGLGSASMAHAAARTREPVSEGMVALMEPFIDTVVICTITALVIVVTGAYLFTDETGAALGDVQMTAAAFNSVIPGFAVILAVAIFLFGYSTFISWAYYISKVWGYFFGEGKLSMTIYKLTYCFLLMPAPFLTVDQVFKVMDSLFFLMAVPNILGIYFLSGELRRDLKHYLARVRSGEIRRTAPLPQAAE